MKGRILPHRILSAGLCTSKKYVYSKCCIDNEKHFEQPFQAVLEMWMFQIKSKSVFFPVYSLSILRTACHLSHDCVVCVTGCI